MLLDASDDPVEVERLVAARVAGAPLEPLLGWAEFAGQRVLIDSGVFVPRRRTSYVVELAVALAPPGPVVVDLCCGSGAIALALGRRLTRPDVYAADADPVAVRCARRNLPPDRVFLGDLFDPLPATLRGRVDVLTANAPYVPTAEIALLPAEARDHEPAVALDGGGDGLDVHRRLLAAVPAWLAPTGLVLIEVSARQVPTASAVFADVGLVPTVVRNAAYEATVLIGRRA